MGRRRRRVIRIVKKKLPTVFVCPRCGEEAVRVSIDKATGRAIVACAICQLKDEFDAHPQAQAIDVYSYFTDRFYGVKDPRAIIPRDRPHPTTAVQEVEEEEEEASDVEEPSRLGPDQTDVSRTESVSGSPVIAGTNSDVGSSTEQVEASSGPAQTPEETEGQMRDEQKTEEEEENPFGDILQSDKEKKRYSSHPIEQESSSSTSD